MSLLTMHSLFIRILLISGNLIIGHALRYVIIMSIINLFDMTKKTVKLILEIAKYVIGAILGYLAS